MTPHDAPTAPMAPAACGTVVVFTVVERADPELTCYFCHRAKCDREMLAYGDGRAFQGLHAKCVERHQRKRVALEGQP